VAVAFWFHWAADGPRRPTETVASRNASVGCRGDGRCGVSTLAEIDIALANGERFAPGSQLDTTFGEPKDLAFVSGTHLRVAGGTTIRYEQGDVVHRFSISRGHAEFSVVHQHAKERFLVSTPDAEIEVHGTVFEVALNDQADACSHRTAVTVSEGIVEVRSSGQRSFITAGNHWPDGCAPAQVKQLVAAKVTPKSLQQLGVGASDSTSPRGPVVSNVEGSVSEFGLAANSSSLAQQNELFARATQALQRDNYAEAIVLYDDLTARYPDGPLAASAAAAKHRARELARKAE
jgi:hypothetical protein